MKTLLNVEKVSKLQEAINTNKLGPGPLMPTLHDCQNIFGCVPLEAQKIISEELKVSVAKINGVVTFYTQFSLEPKGENVVSVCMGTACYVKGSKGILDALSNDLGIEVGETTKDNKFTLEATRCIGACGLAPVFIIGEEIYGNSDIQEAKKVIKKYLGNN